MSIDRLQELLTKLPGIGPRQARRFAFFLMRTNQEYINDLVNTLNELRNTKKHCPECNRIYFLSHAHILENQCDTCAQTQRDKSKILIVAKQADYENIERSGEWDGRYFILGQLVRIADKSPAERLPLALLQKSISDFELEEIVFGLPINTEGEYTKEILLTSLSDFLSQSSIQTSNLARGLSTGTELEYTDPDTISQALRNRS